MRMLIQQLHLILQDGCKHIIYWGRNPPLIFKKWMEGIIMKKQALIIRPTIKPIKHCELGDFWVSEIEEHRLILNHVTKYLKSKGYNNIVTFYPEIIPLDNNTDRNCDIYYIHECLKHIADCDLIYICDGVTKNFPGIKHVINIAKDYGIKIEFDHDGIKPETHADVSCQTSKIVIKSLKSSSDNIKVVRMKSRF